MTVDLSKAEEGDEAEFRCGGGAVIASIDGPLDDTEYPFRVSFDGLECEDEAYTESGRLNCISTPQLLDIIAIHKKPFDWADVKWGMAFDTEEGELVWYIGEHIDYMYENLFVATSRRHSCAAPYIRLPEKRAVTRCPSHDIEVE